MNKNILTVILAISLAISNVGCLSYMTYKGSVKKVAARKAILNNDQAAIRAIRLGENGAGVGIDVSNWEALSEQPLLQLLAAAGDVGIVYAGYKGVESIEESNSDDEDKSGNYSAGRDIINIEGDGNSVNTSSTTPPVVGAPATGE